MGHSTAMEIFHASNVLETGTKPKESSNSENTRVKGQEQIPAPIETAAIETENPSVRNSNLKIPILELPVREDDPIQGIRIKEKETSPPPTQTPRTSRLHMHQQFSQALTKAQPPKEGDDRSHKTLDFQRYIFKIQRAWKRALFHRRLQKFMSKIRERLHLIEELVNSERSYVEYLSLMVELYYEPLKSRKKNQLSKAELDGIFGNLLQILNLNKVILEDLESVAKPGQSTKLSLVFGKLVPFLKMYEVYVKNYDSAFLCLQERCKKDKELVQLLKSGKSDTRSKNLALSDLLSKPFQRIFGYKNIFDRMRKITPKETKVHSDLGDLCDEIEKLVNNFNESKRMYENDKKILDVTRRYSGAWSDANHLQHTLTKHWRRYIREQRLLVRVGQSYEYAECFLANDCLFYILESQLHMYYFCFSSVHESEDDELLLIIKSYPRNCVIRFTNIREREAWYQDIRQFIVEEKHFAQERDVMEDPTDIIKKWKAAAESIPRASDQISNINKQIANLQLECNSDSNKIEELKSDIRAKLISIAHIQKTRMEKMSRTNSMKLARREYISQQQQMVGQCSHCLDALRIMLHDDAAAMNTLFPFSEKNLATVQEQIDKVLKETNLSQRDDEDDREGSDPKIPENPCKNGMMIHTLNLGEKSIINPTVHSEIKKFGIDIDNVLKELLEVVGLINGEEHRYEIISKNFELEQQLATARERIAHLQNEKAHATRRMQGEQCRVLELIKVHDTAIRTASQNDSLLMENEIKLLELTKLSNDLVSQMKTEQLEIQQILRSVSEERDELKDRILEKEQRHEQFLNRSQDRSKPIVSAGKDSGISNSDATELTMKLADKDDEIALLQTEISFLKQRLEIARSEKRTTWDMRMKSTFQTAEWDSTNMKILSGVNERLHKNNATLTRQVKFLNNSVKLQNIQLKDMQSLSINDIQEIRRMSSLIDNFRLEEENLRLQNMRHSFALARLSKIVDDKDKLEKELTEMNRSFQLGKHHQMDTISKKQRRASRHKRSYGLLPTMHNISLAPQRHSVAITSATSILDSSDISVSRSTSLGQLLSMPHTTEQKVQPSSPQPQKSSFRVRNLTGALTRKRSNSSGNSSISVDSSSPIHVENTESTSIDVTTTPMKRARSRSAFVTKPLPSPPQKSPMKPDVIESGDSIDGTGPGGGNLNIDLLNSPIFRKRMEQQEN